MALPVIGAIIAALSITFYLLGDFPTIRAIGIFVAILMIGINGWIISHVAALLAWIQGWAGPFVASITGISIAGIGAALVVVVGYVALRGWLPRNKASKTTFWLSALLAVIIVAGATPFAALNQLPSTVTTGVSTVQGG